MVPASIHNRTGFGSDRTGGPPKMEREWCSKLPPVLGDIERKDAEWEIRNNVMSSLKWQRFFSGEILKKYSEKHARAVSKSKLWFKEFDEERIKDRKDPFATKIFQTSLWEQRTRVTLEDFQLSRSYFFLSFSAKSKRRRRYIVYVSLLPNKRPRDSVLEAVRPFWSPRSCVWCHK